MANFASRQRITVRGEEFRITRVEHNTTNSTLVYATELSELVCNRHSVFDTGVDKQITVVSPNSTKLVVDTSALCSATRLSDETYVHTIEKSELYKGERVTYYAPFTKCDCIEHYRRTWVHFEQRFKY